MKLWPAWYRPTRRLCAIQLIEAAARRISVHPGEITGPCRDAHLVAARAAISRILKDQGGSYPAIGRVLGGRDPTTIQNLVKRYPHHSKVEYNDMLAHLRGVAA